MAPWYENHRGPASRRHRAPAPWRDTTAFLRGEFAHYALGEAGKVFAFTLNLGDEIEAQALEKRDGAKRYLTERIAHHLEVGLGRKVQFWFRLEASDPPASRLHLHGEIGCERRELPKASKALRKAAGKWEDRGVRYQAHTTPDPDNGYVSYAFKSDPGQKYRVLKLATEPAWWHDMLMVTLELKQRSRALYDVARRSVALSGVGIRNYSHDEAEDRGSHRKASGQVHFPGDRISMAFWSGRGVFRSCRRSAHTGKALDLETLRGRAGA